MNTRKLQIGGKIVTLSKVASIKPAGERHVYDLEVRDCHNYFAGGINVHNCSYHAMLTEVGHKHGEDLYRLKDSFVQYRHRKIKVYPAGPDKRVLRGRTRYFACLSADTLVSTSRGLVSIGTDLTGTKTHVGNKNFGILNWAETGIKKVYRVRLANGLSIKGTANHEMKTQRGWVRIDQLQPTDHMQVSLGGVFPEELPLNYTGFYEPKFAEVYREIERLGTFELGDLTKVSSRSITPVTSALRRNGLIERHYHKGRTGAGGLARCYYTACDGFDAEKLIRESSESQSYTRSKCSFPSSMTPELAYLLGYYVADGSYSKQASEFYFATSVKNRARHFLQCFESTFGVRPNRTDYVADSGVNMIRYAVGQNVMKEFLRYVGLEPATSRNKEIPWSILQAPRQCAIAFLSALYDCDGGSNSNYIWYSTTSPRLAEQVQLLLQRFGILSDYKYRYELKSVLIREPYYQKLFASTIGFSTNKLRLRAKRNKGARLPNAHGFVYVPVMSRKFFGTEVVYDITVDDPDHGFTANGMTAHNSIDELGWFPNGADAIKLVKLNADEVYKSLSNSLRTVRAAANLLLEKGFDAVPTAYFVNLSSPSSRRDKIMELVRKSMDSTKIFGIQLPTWRANPTMPRSMFDEEFKRDPVGAMRDFGAEPPLANSPLLSNTDLILAAASTKAKNPIKIKHVQFEGKSNTTLYAKILGMKDGTHPSVLAIDAGYTNNSFACVVGHLIDSKKAKIDLMVEVQPVPGTPLNYSLIYKHILAPIIRRRNVQIFAADRWNSIKLLQDAEDEFGIKHVIYSLKYRDMVAFKDYMESGQLKYPAPTWDLAEIENYNQSEYPHCFKDNPIDHFILQCITVQDTGNSVVKGDQLTDDLVRASMLCLNQLMNPINQELLNSAPQAQIRSSINVASSIALKLGTTSSGSTTTGAVKSSTGRVIGTAKSRVF